MTSSFADATFENVWNRTKEIKKTRLRYAPPHRGAVGKGHKRWFVPFACRKAVILVSLLTFSLWEEVI